MSMARHHAEWLSLVEVSGPFLSMPVLQRAFPQGLDEHDAEGGRQARSAYEEWADNQGGTRPDQAIHRAWIRFVLTEVLGFAPEVLVEGPALPEALAATVAEHHETLRPDLAVLRADRGEAARLLVAVVPRAQGLEKPQADRRWKASPASRMAELLRGAGMPLGLVTNGEQWMLVHAPRGETAGFASWYAETWFDERLTLRAFRSLLSMGRFFSVADTDTPEALLRDSMANQQDVTDQLGYQVRQAVEVLVGTLDRIDRDQGRALLRDTPETTLYEAALTVMMRLVFLFSSEERGLLLLGDPLYDEHYAVSTLGAQLRAAADQAGEEVLERRNDAWSRLLATFRAVHGGVNHEDLRLPAYGGDLFDPDRFPFLEGRLTGTSWRDVGAGARSLPIDNRTVLHLLDALQVLHVKVAGGPAEPRRLSFRALDIEQIGHVYEGLLDHTAKRAPEPVVGLNGGKDRVARGVAGAPGGVAHQERGGAAHVPGRGDGQDAEGPGEGAHAAGRHPGRCGVARGLRQRRGAFGACDPLFMPHPRRQLRSPGRHPVRRRLRDVRHRPAVERHPLHAPQPDRADRPAHPRPAGLHRPGRGQAERGVAAAPRRRDPGPHRL